MFTLYTDTYNVCPGAVLSHEDDHSIERASRALSGCKCKHATTEKEALAIHYGSEHFRLYLLGCHFKIVTNHSTLRWLSSIEPKG